MTKFREVSACLLLVSICTAIQAQTFTQRVVRGFSQPVYATAPVGDNDRLFVLEQASGNIRILDLTTGEITADPFLTVPGLRTGGERGLLGLAFHPDYATNGNFYVYASQPGGSRDHRSHVFEYTVAGDPATSNMADADSQRSILRFDQPFGNHNGGWIGFDPTAEGDARNQLYIATGDGGSANDPENSSQDLEKPLGKILRVDIGGDAFPDDDFQNYEIPASNPFIGIDGNDEIAAYGLRNPWRSSFDRETGDLWIGDVGQGQREEISLLPSSQLSSGLNFGWRVMEGDRCFNTGDARDGNVQCDDPSLTPPVYEYRHGDGTFQGNSVTGGYVYRGPVREFQGQYFFGDFSSGHLWTRDPDSGRVLNRDAELDADVGSANASVASFAEDGAANLYVVNYGGSLYRVDSTSRDAKWVGADAGSGVSGDGASWDDVNNWTRDGVADAAFAQGDHLIVGADLRSTEDRVVSAVTLGSSSVLTSLANLEVTSGNISVEADQSATFATSVDGRIVSPVGAIRKMGEGHLNLRDLSVDSPIYLKEGSATIEGGSAETVVLGTDATLVQSEAGIVIQNLEGDFGTLFLDPLVDPQGALVSDPLLFVEKLDGRVRLTVSNPSSRMTLERGQRTKATILTAVEMDLEFGFEKVRIDNFGELELPGHQGFGNVVTLSTETDATGNSELLLTVMNALPGDTNLDGTVGFADFLILSSNFGEIGGWERGDFGDGTVAFSDFQDLTNNFGLSVVDVPAGVPLNAAVAVPEPSTQILSLFALLTLLVVRRRR